MSVVPEYLERSVNARCAVRIAGLKAGYGSILALHGVDLQVDEGKVIALVGANGASKTTLLRTLSGLIPTRDGRIELFGGTSADVQLTAGLPWEFATFLRGQIFGPLSIEDNLRLGAYLRKGKVWEEDLAKVYRLFPVLAKKRKLPGGTLSGGQQQMLATGRALMGRPKVLLLDEPSMGLAPLLVREILGVVEKLKNQGTTMILVEQNATAALQIADYAYVLEAGRVTLQGQGSELARDKRVMGALSRALRREKDINSVLTIWPRLEKRRARVLFRIFLGQSMTPQQLDDAAPALRQAGTSHEYCTSAGILCSRRVTDFKLGMTTASEFCPRYRLRLLARPAGRTYPNSSNSGAEC